MTDRLPRLPPPRADDPGALSALRAALQDADFTVERVESELGTHELTTVRADLAAYRHRLPSEGPFRAVASLFLLGDAVDAGEAERVLGIAPLSALGICVPDGGDVRATVRLVPHGDYYVASDLDAPVGVETPFDYVPGVQAPSVTLAKLAVRVEAESALDLGTGSGLQALLAARHCDRVVASDINERALAFAAFNAQVNGVDNIELRRGDAFDAVSGEQFDLIVSNPPYVISPDTTYAYRDSEVGGDQLCRQIVEEIPAHLTEGGFAHVLVSWAHATGGAWDEPLREWTRRSGCDAWLLHYRTSDPLAHAVGWLRPVADEDFRAYEDALDRWLSDFRQREIEAVGYGAIVLRRRSGGRNWTRAEQLPLDRLEPASAHTLRVFEANTYLGGLDDERALLDERLALTPHHRLPQTLVCRDGGFQVEEARLELADGLRYTVGLDRYTTLLLPHLDGSCVLREALERAASRIDLTDDGRAQFVPAALPAVRRLLELGFLVPGGVS